MRHASVLAVMLVAGGAAVAADRTPDWEQWRGPARDGVSTDKGLLKKWPDGGPTKLWQAGDIGGGYASCVLGGGLIYTSGKRGDVLAVTALDMNGKKVWQVDHGPAWTANYEGSRGAPTYSDGKLYQLSGKGLLACYDAKTGARAWTVDITSEFGGRPAHWGYAESPLAMGKRLVVTPGGSTCIVALDKATGRAVWTSSGLSDAAHYASCITFTYQNVPMIATMTADGLVGVSARSGQFLWRNARAAGKTAVCPSPVYANGYVFGASGYGNGGACVKLSVSGDGVSATQAWETRDLVNHHGGFVIANGHIYGHSDRGGWTCLELTTGRKVWGERGVGKGSVCYADGMLYTYAESGGRLALVAATPSGYTESGTLSVAGGGQSWAHPVVTGGRLYLRYAETLYVFDVSDPAYRAPAAEKPTTTVRPPAPRTDESFRRPAQPETPEVKARRMLTAAREFVANGAGDMARRALQDLVNQYPETEAAVTASEMLKGM